MLAQVNTKDSGKRLIINLIPTFGKHIIMMTNEPKVGIKFRILSLVFTHPRILFLVFLLFVALASY